MPSALLLVPLALLASTPSRDETPLPEDCRRSPLHDAARARGGLRGQDLDGDRLPDLLRISDQGCGSSACASTLTLELSRGPVILQIDESVSFSALLDPVAIPAALLPAEQGRLRAFVASALFEVVCEAPDPSLAWLLDPEHGLQWRPGPPVMPGSYAVFSTDARMRKLAASRAGERGAGVPEAVWIEYLGANHARTSPEPVVARASAKLPAGAPDAGEPSPTSEPARPAPPAGFRELARRDGLVLLGTAHGVVLRDEARDRSAWIYVQPGGQKLRWPTIAGASFDGEEALVEVDLSQAGQRGLARIRLADGHVTTSACAAERWDASAHACRAP